jgi:adenine-specific DNA-methyltransferase
MSNHKLELTWVVKENLPKRAPRILLVGTAKFYHAEHRVAGNDLFDEAEA